MLPWLILGPLVAAVLVTVIVLLTIRPQPAPAAQIAPAAAIMSAPSPASSPSPAPASSPSPAPASSPSPAPTTSSERQQVLRAYVSTVLIDGASVVSATAGLRNCVSSRREACKKALGNARGQVATFQKDLDATPMPVCMNDADPLLRAGLGFYQKGIELIQQGVNEQNRLHMVQGLLLIGAAIWRTGQAVRTARSSAC